MSDNKKPYGGRYREAVEGYARGMGLTRTQIVIAGAIASFANLETGIAWPGNARIAERARVSPKTVERNLPPLKRSGVIVPWAYESGGRRKSVEYRFPVKQFSGYQIDPWDEGIIQAQNHRHGDGSLENINHRHSGPKPPTFRPKTTDMVTVPSREKKIEEENEALPSRQKVGPSAFPPMDKGEQFGGYLIRLAGLGYVSPGETLIQAKARFARGAEGGACAPAMNEEGRENYAPREAAL